MLPLVARPHDEFDGLALGGNEDRELTLAFQAGDKGAYQAIYDRHHARVHGVCRRMLINRDDAEEAAQETFLRVYQALGRFNGRYQLGAWVTRIATNVCLDHLRAKTRRGGDLAALELSELDLSTNEDEGPEGLVVRNSEGWRVRKVIASLPPLHRAAIVLRDFEGLSYDEVAMTLGISDQQVKALLHRARQRFKRSWVSAAASALVPWRLIDRLRSTDTVAQESVGAQGLSTFAQIAPACSSALQQCGQYVTERLAPAFAAVLLGGATAAALGPSPAPARTHATADEERPRTVVSTFNRASSNEGLSRNESASQRDATVADPDRDSSVPAESTPDEGAPPVEPQPNETPVPTEPSSDGTDDSGTTEGTIEGEAKPDVVRNSFGFDRGAPIPWSEQVAPASNVDCDGMTFDQHLETRLWDGDESYSVSVDLRMQSSGLSTYLEVAKDGHTVSYQSALYVTSSSKSSGKMDLFLEGTYGSHPPDAARAGLPHSGRVTASFTLDCVNTSVINEAMTFGMESDSHNS